METQRDEPPPKVSKLAIAAETEEDHYDTETRVCCYDCSLDDIDQTSGKLSVVVDGVKKATTFARREEVKAWEQEITPCEHTLCLEQELARRIQSQGKYPSQDLGGLVLNLVVLQIWAIALRASSRKTSGSAFNVVISAVVELNLEALGANHTALPMRTQHLIL